MAACLRRLFLSCDRGDVLMEYVILAVFVVAPLAGLYGEVIFDPAGSVDGDFGLLGNAFVKMYHMIMKGISLPIP